MIYEGIGFKEIPGFPKYFASPCGVILSLRRRFPRILTQPNHIGYNKVTIYDADSKPVCVAVHRLVYLTHVGELVDGLVIDHVDGNKLNNHYSNLEQVTYRENSKRAFKLGLSKPKPYSWPGESNPNCSLSDDEIKEIRIMYKNTNKTQQTIAELFNTTQTHVSRLVRGNQRIVGEV